MAKNGSMLFRPAPWLVDSKAVAKLRRPLIPGPQRVLITGGSPDGSSSHMLRSADIYDPVSNRFVDAGPMHAARQNHVSIPVNTRSRLGNPEQILVAGGVGVVNANGDTSYLASAEIFSDGGFHAIADMQVPRAGAAAAKTSSGRILIAGGQGVEPDGPTGTSLRSAEYLSAATAAVSGFTFVRTFVEMANQRVNHSATPVRILASRFPAVLVVGGGDSAAQWTAEVYVVRDDDFGITLPNEAEFRMRYPRVFHAAALLNDGRVLVCGGKSTLGSDLEWDQAELFDPMTLTFSESVPMGDPPTDYRRVGPMNERRQGHTATTLPDGRVLITGGIKTVGTQRNGDPVYALLNKAEIFDPQTVQFTMSAAMVTPRKGHTATALGDGRVLIAGGVGQGVDGGVVLDTGEVFDPGTNTFTAVGNSMGSRRVHHAAAPM